MKEILTAKPDIIPIIEQVTPLRNKKGLCPFHDDRNPSFVVNPHTQTFKCFGCGAHGDVVDFVCLYYGLSFKEALSYLGISTRPKKTKRNRPYLIKELKAVEIEIHFREFMKEYSAMLGSFMRAINRALLNKGIEMDFSDLYEEEYAKALPGALKKARTASEAGTIKMLIDMQREYAGKLRIIHGDDRQAKIRLYMDCLKQGAVNE